MMQLCIGLQVGPGPARSVPILFDAAKSGTQLYERHNKCGADGWARRWVPYRFIRFSVCQAYSYTTIVSSGQQCVRPGRSISRPCVGIWIEEALLQRQLRTTTEGSNPL